MKHNRLHSVAHNFADSLASGLGFVVGYCSTDVFKDAAANGDSGVIVDFLTGEVLAEHCSKDLSDAIPRYRKAFPAFCRKHGVDSRDFRLFRARFFGKRLYNRLRFTVTIEDSSGRCSSREYGGVPGQRLKQLDDLGRLRPKVLPEPDARTLEIDPSGS